MTLKTVNSHDHMLSLMNEGEKNYVLLYKKGSETSECSLKSIENVVSGGTKANVVAADVSSVRDIHEKYGITSAPTLLVFQGKDFEKTVKGCNDDGYYKSLFESALFNASADNDKPQKRVTVYTTPTCSWCNTLKTHLNKNGVRYTEVDVSKDLKAATEMTRKSGQQGVPQTDINGQMIIGFDKVKINNLLGIK